MTEGQGSELEDLSGNGNGGTIYGATWSGDAPVLPVFGCTDAYAINYNSDANVDDGSCSMAILITETILYLLIEIQLM